MWPFWVLFPCSYSQDKGLKKSTGILNCSVSLAEFFFLFVCFFLRQNYFPTWQGGCFGELHRESAENERGGSPGGFEQWQGKGTYLRACAPRSPLRHDAVVGTQKRAGLRFWRNLILVAQAVIHSCPFTISSIHAPTMQDHKVAWTLKTVRNKLKIVMIYPNYLPLKDN